MPPVSLPIIRRRLFTIVSAVSLVLVIATVVLWVRSYWCCDLVVSVDGSRGLEHQFWSNAGVISLVRLRSVFVGKSQWIYSKEAPSPNEVAVGYDRDKNWERLCFPHWLPAILFAILPAFWFFNPHRRRARRLRLGLCPVCGYDLRASPERCPEWGLAVAAPA